MVVNAVTPSSTFLSIISNNIFKSFAYQEGLVELQDASSQMSICSLPCRLDGAILDFCAGGGGKSLALAAWFKSCLLYTSDAADE